MEVGRVYRGKGGNIMVVLCSDGVMEQLKVAVRSQASAAAIGGAAEVSCESVLTASRTIRNHSTGSQQGGGRPRARPVARGCRQSGSRNFIPEGKMVLLK